MADALADDAASQIEALQGSLQKLWDTTVGAIRAERYRQTMALVQQAADERKRQDAAAAEREREEREAAEKVKEQAEKGKNGCGSSTSSGNSKLHGSWFNLDNLATSTSSSSSSKVKAAQEHLPAWKARTEFLRLVDTQPVTLVLGQTGCGKSTQLPQFLLSAASPTETRGTLSTVVCTQPRRLAAISLARRVSFERGEDGSVGHCVRGDVSIPKNSRLVFCTVGSGSFSKIQ
eukprot:GSA25T00014043001.1